MGAIGSRGEGISKVSMAELVGRLAGIAGILYFCMGRERLSRRFETIFIGLDYCNLLFNYVDGDVSIREIYMAEARRPVFCSVCSVCSLLSH